MGQLNKMGSIIKKCAGCSDKTLCPSFCPECSSFDEEYGEKVFYCNYCRALPCTRETCPIGHELERVE
jgi:hypothetical protein